MDKFQAAFEILYLLAIGDGSLDNREIDTLNAYVNDNLGQSDYDTHATARSLDLLSRDGKIQELAKAAAFLNDVCNAQDKISLMDFAYRVITADQILTDGEKTVFVALANEWHIDLDQFLAARQ